MSAFVQLGKAGDILSVLPILQNDQQGGKPKLVVSREYAYVVEDLDFLEPVIYPGAWQDLGGAVLSAKKRFDNVLVPQTHSNQYNIQRHFPSFQLDQWNRCGRLADWGKLELKLPRNGCRNPIEGRFILLADHSQSSPFDKADDLYHSLSAAFPSHTVVRLSTVRVHRLTDLLVIYDAADLLVLIDTMHLHLSAASATPVIALIADKPSRWHGSAYHPRMLLHVRYGDYEQRRQQIIATALRAVNNSPIAGVTPVETAHKNGYNLSLLQVGDNLWKTYRHHPDIKSWRTVMALEVGGVTTAVTPPEQYARHSIEDGRLFLWKGKPHLSATISRSKLPGQNFSPCVTGFGELAEDGRITNWVEPRIGQNDWTGQEKNHVYFEWEGALHVIYRCAPGQMIYQLDSRFVPVKKFITKTPACAYGEVRGGTQPFEFGDHWLRFVHTNQVNQTSDLWWTYHLAAVVMDRQPPFQIRDISRLPILTGHEMFYQHKFWKPRVLIVYGAVKHGAGWRLGVGVNDSACGTITVTKNDLNL